MRGSDSFECRASSVGEALSALFESFPSLRERVLNDRDEVVSYVTLFLGDDDIRTLRGTQTPLEESDTIFIVPAIVGG